MAQYFREFSGDSTGSTPADFTARWATSGSWTVETYGAGQALKLVDPGASHKGASWNDIDADADRANVEVYVNWATTLIGTTTEPLWYVAVRADGTKPQPDNGYLVGQRTTTAARLRKRVGGTVTTLSSPAFTAATDTNYHLVLRVNGSSLYVKQWGGALEDEPGTWNLVDGLTDGDVTAAGWTALVGVLNDATLHVSALGVGTNGDAAPRSGGVSLRGLVLASGRIRQCPVGEEGLHPALSYAAGRLHAGAVGTRLVLDGGRIRQAQAGETVIV